MSCKIDGCTNLGKLKKDGSRQFPKGYCNTHYQELARENEPRITSYYKMINRCRNPNNDGYKDYGGRGIRVWKGWLPENEGFKQFCRDMGERPEGTTLDRINVNGHYTPSNCRWADIHTQNNNRRERLGTEDTFYNNPHRGVTFRKYKYTKGKVYLNKHCHWCASIWVNSQHIRIYCDDRETAIMARLAMEIEFLGATLD